MKCIGGKSRWKASSGLSTCVVTPAPSIVISAAAAARGRRASSAPATSESDSTANGAGLNMLDQVERVARGRAGP